MIKLQRYDGWGIHRKNNNTNKQTNGLTLPSNNFGRADSLSTSKDIIVADVLLPGMLLF